MMDEHLASGNRRADGSSEADRGSSGGEASAIPAEGPALERCYADHVAAALMDQAGDLGRSWVRRGAVAVGVGPAPSGLADASPDIGPVEDIIRTLAAAACEGSRWHEQAMHDGWETGAAALRRGTSLNQLLKELDGGVMLVLRAIDAATRGFAGPTTAADGLAVARRISDAASLLRLAAAGGYTRGMVDELRSRYRTIRHDLRNPLGTITTAVALMDDESVPEATRQNPKVRAMVARNARSMEAMIASTLGDPAAQLPALVLQATSIRELACAVRGDLTAAVDGIDVVVGDDLPTFPLDSAGLELLIKAVVIAVARAAGSGVRVVIDLAELTPRTVTIAIHPRAADASASEIDLGFARQLAGRLDGRIAVHAGQQVHITIPVAPLPAGRADDSAMSVRPASAGNERDDVAGNGQGADGEAFSL